MKQKNLMIILIPVFIVTILWVLSNVYHNLRTSTIEEYVNLQIAPIDNKFDNETIEKIKQRKRIELSKDIIIQASITPTPQANISATDSASVNIAR